MDTQLEQCFLKRVKNAGNNKNYVIITFIEELRYLNKSIDEYLINNMVETNEEIIDKYDKLSDGVNQLGENISLTNDEYPRE